MTENETRPLDAFDRMLIEARRNLSPYDEHGNLQTELTPAEVEAATVATGTDHPTP